MRSRCVYFTISILLLSAFSYGQGIDCANQSQYQFLTILNEFRAENGMDKLKYDKEMTQAAHQHNEDMLINGYLNINISDSVSFRKRLLENDVYDYQVHGFVFRGGTMEEIKEKAFSKQKPAFLMVMISDITHTGYNIIKDGDEFLVTVYFGKRYFSTLQSGFMSCNSLCGRGTLSQVKPSTKLFWVKTDLESFKVVTYSYVEDKYDYNSYKDKAFLIFEPSTFITDELEDNSRAGQCADLGTNTGRVYKMDVIYFFLSNDKPVAYVCERLKNPVVQVVDSTNQSYIKFLTILNEFRAENGMEKLKYDSRMGGAAHRHNMYMQRNGYLNISIGDSVSFRKMLLENKVYDYEVYCHVLTAESIPGIIDSLDKRKSLMKLCTSNISYVGMDLIEISNNYVLTVLLSTRYIKDLRSSWISRVDSPPGYWMLELLFGRIWPDLVYPEKGRKFETYCKGFISSSDIESLSIVAFDYKKDNLNYKDYIGNEELYNLDKIEYSKISIDSGGFKNIKLHPNSIEFLKKDVIYFFLSNNKPVAYILELNKG